MARSNKRKRQEYMDGHKPEAVQEKTPESEVTTAQLQYDESPFVLEWVKDPATAPSKKAKTTKTGKLKDATAPKEEEGIPESGLNGWYTVSPGWHWDQLRKYRNFVVNPHNDPPDDATQKFELGQFVFVNHSEESKTVIQDDKESWVAQVRECRAHGQHAVYIRVLWFYWPDELPAGREAYHGERELVASNYHQVIDAMTVSGKASVHHLRDVHDMSEIPPDALYWRQTIDIQKRPNKVSTLPKDCICKTVTNPDSIAIKCPHEACGKWQHEACITNAVLTQYWENRKIETPGTNGKVEAKRDTDDDQDMGETIVATAKSGGLFGLASSLGRTMIGRLQGTSNGSTPKLTPKAARKSSVKKKRRVSKVDMVIDMDKPWEDKLQAKLQFTTNTRGSPEFTGNVTIYRVSVDDGEQVLEDLSQVEAACLFCGLSLTGDQSPGAATLQTPDDEADACGAADEVSEQKPVAILPEALPRKPEYDAVREAAASNMFSADELSLRGSTTNGVGNAAQSSSGSESSI